MSKDINDNLSKIKTNNRLSGSQFIKQWKDYLLSDVDLFLGNIHTLPGLINEFEQNANLVLTRNDILHLFILIKEKKWVPTSPYLKKHIIQRSNLSIINLLLSTSRVLEAFSYKYNDEYKNLKESHSDLVIKDCIAYFEVSKANGLLKEAESFKKKKGSLESGDLLLSHSCLQQEIFNILTENTKLDNREINSRKFKANSKLQEANAVLQYISSISSIEEDSKFIIYVPSQEYAFSGIIPLFEMNNVSYAFKRKISVYQSLFGKIFFSFINMVVSDFQNGRIKDAINNIKGQESIFSNLNGVIRLLSKYDIKGNAFFSNLNFKAEYESLIDEEKIKIASYFKSIKNIHNKEMFVRKMVSIIQEIIPNHVDRVISNKEINDFISLAIRLAKIMDTDLKSFIVLLKTIAAETKIDEVKGESGKVIIATYDSVSSLYKNSVFMGLDESNFSKSTESILIPYRQETKSLFNYLNKTNDSWVEKLSLIRNILPENSNVLLTYCFINKKEHNPLFYAFTDFWNSSKDFELHGTYFHGKHEIKPRERFLDKSLSKRLYQKNNSINISASQINTLFQCNYKFFLQYGLKLSRYQFMRIDNGRIGTLVHEILEMYFELGFIEKNITMEEVENKLVECAWKTETTKKLVSWMLLDDNDAKYLIQYVTRRIKKFVLDMHNFYKDSKIEVIGKEKNIGKKEKILIFEDPNNNRKFYFNGTIDQIIKKEGNIKDSYTIIDFKRSEKSTSLKDILILGKDFQIPLYMRALGIIYPKLKKNIRGGYYLPYFPKRDRKTINESGPIKEVKRIKDFIIETENSMLISLNQNTSKNFVDWFTFEPLQSWIEKQIINKYQEVIDEGNISTFPLVERNCMNYDFGILCGERGHIALGDFKVQSEIKILDDEKNECLIANNDYETIVEKTSRAKWIKGYKLGV